jgi:GntR family carbon starvation induced transcriptional regulator
VAELTQAERAYQRLRSDILKCRIRPGSRILINEVASELDVSAGAIREALSRLAAENLAVATAQKGFSVPPVSQSDLEYLTEARLLIEERCIEEAILHADLEWESNLVAAFHRLQNIPEIDPDQPGKLNEAWAAAHARYHRAIVAGCPNTWLLKIRDNLYEQTERYRQLSVPLRTKDRNVAAEHEALTAAVISRNVELSKKLIREHLRLTARIVIDSPLMSDTPKKSEKVPAE